MPVLRAVLGGTAFAIGLGVSNMTLATEPLRLDNASLDQVTAGIAVGPIDINLGENGNYGIGNTGTNNRGFLNNGDGNRGALNQGSNNEGILNGVGSSDPTSGNDNRGAFNGVFNTGPDAGNENKAYPVVPGSRSSSALTGSAPS